MDGWWAGRGAGRRAFALAALLAASGCASVRVEAPPPDQLADVQRSDIVSTGRLSEATHATLRSAAIEPSECGRALPMCLERLRNARPLSEEDRFASLAEIATMAALSSTAPPGIETDTAIARWLQVARYAYGYLFLAPPTAPARVFDERQNQVVDYYNLAVQRVTTGLVDQDLPDIAAADPKTVDLRVGQWDVTVDFSGFQTERVTAPKRVLASSGLRFDGLSTIFRREGFGAEMVVELQTAATGATTPPGGEALPFSRMPFAPLSVVIDFPGSDLKALLEGRRATVYPLSPLEHSVVTVRGQTLPLTANFSAGYGMWLAESSFAGQATRSLLGRPGGISQPQIYLMQRFDPKRRILLMIHGLGSSPEAWVNLANEVMGDELLRSQYQIWQVYYPTNLPIPWNLREIRMALQASLDAVDPDRTSLARRDIVVVGHSMGGVLARLLVSNGGPELTHALAQRGSDGTLTDAVIGRLRPFVSFEAMPGVRRAIFIAAPHRGTASAGSRLGRLAARLVRTPHRVQERVTAALGGRAAADQLARVFGQPSSISTLRNDDPFTQAAQDLPIDSDVAFHSIIGVTNLEDSLEDASDGLVAYSSAHLEGATSELIVQSDHHVQERLQAMLELRRILRLHLKRID